MSQTIEIPDFVVRQVGALQLQLAAAQEEIAQLRAELARQVVVEDAPEGLGS